MTAETDRFGIINDKLWLDLENVPNPFSMFDKYNKPLSDRERPRIIQAPASNNYYLRHIKEVIKSEDSLTTKVMIQPKESNNKPIVKSQVHFRSYQSKPDKLLRREEFRQMTKNAPMRQINSRYSPIDGDYIIDSVDLGLYIKLENSIYEIYGREVTKEMIELAKIALELCVINRVVRSNKLSDTLQDIQTKSENLLNLISSKEKNSPSI